MERREMQIAGAVLIAAIVGFLVALVAFGGDSGGDNAAATSTTSTTAATTATTATAGTTGTTATTTTQQQGTAPTTTGATTSSCIQLWNGPGNRPAQTFLINVASQQPVRIHVGTTTDTPPKCLVTVVANNGDAYVFPEGGGATYPYAPAASKTTSGELPEAQKTTNALEQRDGTLVER